PCRPSAPISGHKSRGNTLSRSMASARGAIRSCAKPFTVLRNISTSAPRPKSNPAQALGIMRGLRSHAKLYNLDITMSAPRLPFYLACARKLVGASAGAGLANGKPCIPLLPTTRGERGDKVLVDLQVVDRKRCRYRGWNVRLVDQDALGDFQDKMGWCDAASRQCRANQFDDSAVAHLQRRKRESVALKPTCPPTGCSDTA